MKFKLKSDFTPQGDQITAIAELVEGINAKTRQQTLLGVTGSGKTFTMANVIQQIQMPTLILSHNKTLAAQLFEEFKEFFPENAVEYFVSFYDFYQPEAYIPSTDTYIEKTADINQEIDRLRLKATSSLMSRSDVIIVASVSCIYNIGSPESYSQSSVTLDIGVTLDRDVFFKQLLVMQYVRNDASFERGTYRVRGDVIDIYPAYETTGIRIETFGNQIEKIGLLHSVSGKIITPLERMTLFPAKHFVNSKVSIADATAQIRREMELQLEKFERENKLVEAQRLKQRTLYDIEMLTTVGYVNGIENYSRIFDGRSPDSRPYSLIDFFNKPFLTIIDESHASIPQVRGMYNGDRARKETLVNHGFRIPSALDNCPLKFFEFEELMDFVIYSSATPGDYELERCDGIFVEQVIRPTGLVDPPITIKPASTQIDDLIEELRKVVERNERALVTTLTKKMAEDLTEYLESLDFKVRYIHSEIQTLERLEILRDLREGVCDVLIGINLLREGLDLPEVALVAILDADREGFLRSHRSLIQIAGRAARNINGNIILYADTKTESIRKAIDETNRRRLKQLEYNRTYNITPRSTIRKFSDALTMYKKGEQSELPPAAENTAPYTFNDLAVAEDIPIIIKQLEKEMAQAAKKLEFEKAARFRDEIAALKKSVGK